jgi:large subunit ribosomal protein L22
MKAILTNYRQSPRKVRLVTTLIKGKNVAAAIHELDTLVKRGSAPVKKVLLSAIANAVKNNGKVEANLYVKEARVDEGTVLKRFMPRARGQAKSILKRSSHILITLEEKSGK